MGMRLSTSLFYGVRINPYFDDIDDEERFNKYGEYVAEYLEDVDVNYVWVGHFDDEDLFITGYYEHDLDERGTSLIDNLKKYIPEPDKLIDICKQHNLKMLDVPKWYNYANYG